jgi:hypothetical protein
VAQAREYSPVKVVKTVSSIDAAIDAVKSYHGETNDFVLRVHQSVFVIASVGGHMATGVQAALITDAALGRGWWPCEVVDDGEHRVFTYTE